MTLYIKISRFQLNDFESIKKISRFQLNDFESIKKISRFQLNDFESIKKISRFQLNDFESIKKYQDSLFFSINNFKVSLVMTLAILSKTQEVIGIESRINLLVVTIK
ncbi:hypothetical protein SAMN02910297_00966 [Methanobrevibacter olleyae]|uniref:Uncharacterized protein n=1 Tax=Methanobrevibacter olleyae TaxID=294671 RepID=A0A1I4HZ75_METOL|nr:hypothetical protein SAMN02910297_00966 [Methanobrevibacter olleyae]